MPPLALAALLVIDLTRYIAGPYCTKLRADYGARVSKIERCMTRGVVRWGLGGVVAVLGLLWSVAGGYAQDVKSWETATAAGARAFDQGQYAEAAQRFRAALRIAEALTPENAPEEDDPVTWRVATSLLNLATVYHVQDLYPDALPLYERALLLYERMFGPEHPQLLDLLQAYVALLRRMFPVWSRFPWSMASKLQARIWRIQEREMRAMDPAPAGSMVDDISDIFRPSE
jgi:tetratricopeptide (TPR) repeat protein